MFGFCVWVWGGFFKQNTFLIIDIGRCQKIQRNDYSFVACKGEESFSILGFYTPPSLKKPLPLTAIYTASRWDSSVIPHNATSRLHHRNSKGLIYRGDKAYVAEGMKKYQ